MEWWSDGVVGIQHAISPRLQSSECAKGRVFGAHKGTKEGERTLRWFAGGEVDRGRSVITRRDDADFVPIHLPPFLCQIFNGFWRSFAGLV